MVELAWTERWDASLEKVLVANRPQAPKYSTTRGVSSSHLFFGI